MQSCSFDTLAHTPRGPLLAARSYYYVKSYADGSGIVRLPMGIV